MMMMTTTMMMMMMIIIIIIKQMKGTPLDLVRANANELPTDEEYNNKVKRQWSQKALHGRHPYDLSQQYVDTIYYRLGTGIRIDLGNPLPVVRGN